MKALQRLERDRGADKNRPLRDEVLASEATRTTGRGNFVQLLLGTSVGVVFASALLGLWWLVSPMISSESAEPSSAVVQVPSAQSASAPHVAAPPVNRGEVIAATPSPRNAVAPLTLENMTLDPVSSPKPLGLSTTAPHPSAMPDPTPPSPVPSMPAMPPMVADSGMEEDVVEEVVVDDVVVEEVAVKETVVEEIIVEETVIEVIEVIEEPDVVEVVETWVVETEVVKEEDVLEGVEEILSPVEKPEDGEVKEVAVKKSAPAPKEEAKPAGLGFPEFFVKKTVWHPRSEQRVAYVSIPKDGDAQPVREGDTIESLEVIAIEPAAVTLGRDGVEVRKRVGEN